LEHFKYDEQGLIHTPSDDHDYDFAAAEGDEDEMSLGNVDEMQSNSAAEPNPVQEKPKKDKKQKKDKKKKDKKDKKERKHKLHRNSEVKAEDLPAESEHATPANVKKTAADDDIVGKKRRMKRNIVDDDEDE
jgi:outer membrane biosynthesis protein TonB